MGNSVRLILFGLMVLPVLLWSQAGNNPFDIVRTDDTLAAPVGNVFDIQNRLTTTITPNEIIASDTSVLQDSVFGSESLSNPFEVDHVPIRRKSLTAAGTLTVKEEIKSSENLFILWLIILCVLIMALIFNTGMPLIKRIIRSLSNENILKQVYRDSEKQGQLVFYILYLIFFITGSALIYLLLYRYDIMDGFWDYTKVFGGLVGLYFLRHIAMWILGWAFPVDKESSLYSFTIMVYNIAIGIMIMPLLLLLAFGPSDLFWVWGGIAIGIVALLLLTRMIRGLFIGLPYMLQHALHFFLYLCIFEIAPVLLLFKVVQV